jgi:hypothetical protein
MTLPEPTPPGSRGPTATSRIYQALLDRPEDFMSVRQLMAATGCTYNQTTAALFQLRRYQAADVVIEASGSGWWFATPDTDLRSRTVDERRVEEPGSRRHRISRVVLVKPTFKEKP